MSDDKEKDVFVTGDKGILEGGKLHEADKRAMNPAGFIEIKTVDQLMALANAARHTYDAFHEEIVKQMTPERAARVRVIRAEDEYTWRALADKTHQEWGADATWSPPSNQLAGMALCEAAAKVLGEDHQGAPWN